MRSFDQLLSDAATMHRGFLCPGQVLGVRMAMLGCRLLDIEEPTQGKRLIVYVEIDRCMADAIAAVTGCRLGKRTLKHMDYGKCASTFIDLETDHAVRVLARDDARDEAWRYASPGLDKRSAQCEGYRIMPDEELFVVQEVLVPIPSHDRPGPPVSRVPCSVCGEGVNDRRQVWLDGQMLCRACAHGGYYQIPSHSLWLTFNSSSISILP
ncbi:MAG: formylmethanofuran dehydrogenase [Proteobacteria bacterium]|nr:formylmethanofuran dehydrogenase [Pseudomonadota bacterium]